MRSRGDLLLEQVCSSGNDVIANELLREFWRGYPVEHLRRLLASDQEDAIKAGAWIASELGVRVAPLMVDLIKLLDHPLRYVRFFALDAILLAATSAHGDAIAKATELVGDIDAAVRWQVLGFLSRATSEQLGSAECFLDSVARERLEWMRRPLNDDHMRSIVSRIDDGDRVNRMYGVAAAVRVVAEDTRLLEHAASSPDEEIRSFAREELDSHGIVPPMSG